MKCDIQDWILEQKKGEKIKPVKIGKLSKGYTRTLCTVFKMFL